MPYKKQGQRKKLLDLARKSRERAQARRKAKESRVGGKRYVTPLSKAKPKAKAKVTRHGGTTITYKPKPSPHLRTAPKKPSHGRVIPKDITGRTAKSTVKPPTGKTRSSKPTAGIPPKRGSLTAAQKRANEQRRKNLRSEIEGRMKPDDVGRLAKLYGKVMGKEMTHRDEAALAGHMATEGLTLMLGGPVWRGGKTAGAAALGGIKTGGAKALTGAKAGLKATGQAARTGAKATKRAARKARVALKKADRRLLKAQGLSRQGGRVRKIKEPNPFGAKAAKGKPKPKAKSDKKNPFAGPAKPKAKGKQLDEHVKARYRLNERKARKAKRAQRKSMEQDAHVKAYRGDKVKKGKRKAEAERKRAVASNKRAAEKKKSEETQKGYAQQRIDARKRSRKRGKT